MIHEVTMLLRFYPISLSIPPRVTLPFHSPPHLLLSPYIIHIVLMFALCLLDSEDNLNGDCAKLHLFSDSSLIVTFCHKISNKKTFMYMKAIVHADHFAKKNFLLIHAKNKYKIGT